MRRDRLPAALMLAAMGLLAASPVWLAVIVHLIKE